MEKLPNRIQNALNELDISIFEAINESDSPESAQEISDEIEEFLGGSLIYANALAENWQPDTPNDGTTV